MTTLVYIGSGLIGLCLLIVLVWRFASHRHSLPCPVWLRWLVELDNPFTKTNRANVIIQHLNLQAGLKVLDVGCGPGRLTIPVAEQIGPQGEVVALDLQAGMLRRAQERAQAAHLSNIRFLQVGVGAGQLERNQYDRALLVTVLGEIPDRKSALTEIFEALKPGGILSVTEVIFDPHFQGRSTVRELAAAVGFKEQGCFGNRLSFTMNLEKPSGATKADEYRTILRELDHWDAYLLKESGLPGPRGNLELAQVVADEGNLQLFQRYMAYTAAEAPTNSPYEFLAFCGIVGLGRLLAEGDHSLLEILRRCASDPRWRIREAVAMALQRLGDVDMERLITEMRAWSQGPPLEQRAAAAALCEPRLLGQAQDARAVLGILDQITAGIEQADHRRSKDFLTLRKGLGYCWSVAVVALPVEGKALMEKWLVKSAKDVRWIMKENLKKARLVRMDADWVKKWRGKIEG